MKTERIGIRITKDLKKKLEVLARKEHRSFSNYVELILVKHIEEKRATDGEQELSHVI
jgi:predicted DNA-binding protein